MFHLIMSHTRGLDPATLDRVFLFYIDGGETPSPQRGESVPLVYREEANFVSIKERVSLFYVGGRETPFL